MKWIIRLVNPPNKTKSVIDGFSNIRKFTASLIVGMSISFKKASNPKIADIIANIIDIVISIFEPYFIVASVVKTYKKSTLLQV